MIRVSSMRRNTPIGYCALRNATYRVTECALPRYGIHLTELANPPYGLRNAPYRVGHGGVFSTELD